MSGTVLMSAVGKSLLKIGEHKKGGAMDLDHELETMESEENRAMIKSWRSQSAIGLRDIYSHAGHVLPTPEYFRNYVDQLTGALVIGISCGDYFSQIIPRSSDRPTKPYSHQPEIPNILKFEAIKLDLLASGSRSRQPKCSRSFYSRVLEQRLPDIKAQTIFNRHLRDDGGLVVDETVENVIWREGNAAEAYVSVSDGRGQRLDLNMLLPQGYKLCPGRMINWREGLSADGQRWEVNFRRVDLRKYPGLARGGTRFSVSPTLKKVIFGNLVESGGILSILHEIAHAWQTAYYERNPRKDFEDFQERVGLAVGRFWYARKCISEGSMDPSELPKCRKAMERKLVGSGVMVDEDELEYVGQSLTGDQVMIGFGGCRFVVHAKQAAALRQAYAKEERDAWAHAVHMLHFCRQSGLDLEPRLRTLADLRSIVHGALGTYQVTTAGMIGINDPSSDFIRRGNRKGA